MKKKKSKKKKKGITVVQGDGFCALYINNKLLYEDYDINLICVNDCFKTGIKILQADDEWLEANTCYPTKLKDVKLSTL